MTGTRTVNISNRVSLADEIIVNRDGSTAVMEFDSLATQLAGVGAVSEALKGAAAGTKRAKTLSGLGAGDRIGQPAQVTEGADKGEYYWTGTIWERTGDLVDAAAQAVIKSTVAPSAIYFGTAPIFYDYNGLYGQARTFYFSRDFLARTVDGSTNLTIGAASARIPGYAELQVPDAVSLYKVIINRTTGVLSIPEQASLPALSSNAIYLFDVRGAVVSNARYPVQPVAAGIGGLHAYEPFVIESDRTILCPRVAWNSTLFSTSRPAPIGLFETEMAALAPSATAQVLYFDQVEAAKGLTPFKVANNPNWPESPLTFPILSSAGGDAPFSSPRGVPVIGAVPGGSVPNIANLGRNEVARATLRFSTTADATITAAALTALGFTAGVADAAGSPFYGPVLSDIQPDEYRPIRVYMQTDVDDSFPDVRAYLIDGGGVGRAAAFLKMEKKLSPRAAIFFGWYKVPTTASYFPAKGIYVGTLNATGRDIRFCGLQIGKGSRTKLWVMRSDYPDPTQNQDQSVGALSDGKMILPGELFLIEGREQIIYGDQIFETRTDGQDAFLALEARSMMPGNIWPLPISDKRSLKVSGGQVSPQSTLVARTISQPDKDTRYVRDLKISTAAPTALAGKSALLLPLGDSLTEYTGFPQAAARELARSGMTLGFVGTVDIREADGATGGDNLVKGEGRGSRDWRNYTYEDGLVTSEGGSAYVKCDPFPNSFIPTYLAMTTAQKKDYNPFLRPAIAGDPAQRIFNGHIFDPEWYRNRPWGFTIPMPTHACVNLGTNDIAHGGLPAKSDAVSRGLETVVGQFRDKWPTTHIGLMINPLPRTSAGDARWAQQVMLWKLHMDYIASRATDLDASGRPYVSLIPAYAHASSDIGYTQTAGSTDSQTGRKVVTMTDPLHFRGSVKEQVGRSLAAWIACRVTNA